MYYLLNWDCKSSKRIGLTGLIKYDRLFYISICFLFIDGSSLVRNHLAQSKCWSVSPPFV